MQSSNNMSQIFLALNASNVNNNFVNELSRPEIRISIRLDRLEYLMTLNQTKKPKFKKIHRKTDGKIYF